MILAGWLVTIHSKLLTDNIIMSTIFKCLEDDTTLVFF